jgi:hypothetical protein
MDRQDAHMDIHGLTAVSNPITLPMVAGVLTSHLVLSHTAAVLNDHLAQPTWILAVSSATQISDDSGASFYAILRWLLGAT